MAALPVFGDAHLQRVCDVLGHTDSGLTGTEIGRQLVQRAEKEQWSYRDFLALLVAEEIAQRQQTRLGRLSRRARGCPAGC